MKNIFTIILTCTVIAASAQSPVAIRKKVATLPKAFEKPDERTDIYNNSEQTSLPWIVFSDRAENYTYTTPGGTLVMKKLNFMETFYVSAEKNGYLKLIKYQQGMVQGRKLINKKGAQSYGWISAAKVLPWQSAFYSNNSFPSKYITIISGKQPMMIPSFYYDKGDSVYVFNSPELEQKKTKVALHQIVYAFKKSADGKKMLIGSDTQLIPDSAAASIYGWVGADALHSYGDRLYISSAKEVTPEADDSVANYLNRSMKLNGPDANDNHYAFDPLISADEPLLRSLPVTKSTVPGSIALGLATNVYDKTNNGILNIKGGHLGYKDYINIRNNIHHINVVFVVDGGSSMRNYYSGITSTVQSFENIFNGHTKGNTITYGGVVYRSKADCAGAGGVQSTAFATDYRKLINFLEAQGAVTKSCVTAINSQPVFEGIRGALNMFKSHQHETNLIVLIGTTGAATYSAEDISSVANDLAKADARLLAIQVYSDRNALYNDFVIQSRQVVTQSAIQLADRKKDHLVSGEGLTKVQQFNTSLSDSVSFYLDFPKNSMIQGAVVFPPKGVVKSNMAMRVSVDRLMKETDWDIHSQVRQLDSAFRLTGRENRYVQPVVTAQVAPVTSEFGNNMPHNAFKYYLTADAKSDVVNQSSSQLQYLLILNEQEYKQFTDLLSLMTGENLQQDASNFRKKLFKNYINIVKKRLNYKISRGDIRSMTLANYFKLVTDLPVPDDKVDYLRRHVSDLKGSMPQTQFEQYIKFLIACGDVIKRSTLVDQHFISNGKTYYYITQANLK